MDLPFQFGLVVEDRLCGTVGGGEHWQAARHRYLVLGEVGVGVGGSKMQKSSRSNQPCKREVLSEGCVWLISCHFLVYFVGRFPLLARFG